MIIRSS